MGLTVAVVRIALAVVFLSAAAGKLLDLPGSRRAASEFGLPRSFAGIVGIGLPIAELLIALALLPQSSARWAGLAALVILISFIAAIARLMSRGEAPDCHCFGQLHSEPAGSSTLVRNAALALGAALVLITGPGRSLAGLGSEEIALTIISVALVALAAYTSSLRQEHRKLAQRPSAWPAGPLGLPIGTPAPNLALQTLAGEQISLSALIGDGTPAVLVHVSPECGPCRALAPDLRRWQKTLAHDLHVLAVGSGELEATSAFAREVELSELLASEPAAFGNAYHARATPSAVLLDGKGRVAARTVAGHIGIESLIRVALARVGAEVPGAPLDMVHVSPGG